MNHLKIFIFIFITSLSTYIKPQKPINMDSFLRIFSKNQNMECVMPGREHPVPILSTLVTMDIDDQLLSMLLNSIVHISTNLDLDIQQTHPLGIPVHVNKNETLALIEERFPEYTTFEGWTPLMWATFCNKILMVKKLIEFGVNKYIENLNGLTAKNIAEIMEYHELVELLD